jgi:hypothetical protein
MLTAIGAGISEGPPKVSTLWLYLRIQAAVFVCGIVGPIFLGVYFAAQPAPELKWMYFAGLFITAIDILVALTITDGATRNRAITDKTNSG